MEWVIVYIIIFAAIAKIGRMIYKKISPIKNNDTKKVCQDCALKNNCNDNKMC